MPNALPDPRFVPASFSIFDFSDLLVVFDLDGTLVDTAPDLVGALNFALAEDGLPPVEVDEARHLVGHGAAALLAYGHKAAGREWSDDVKAQSIARLIAFYRENIAVESRPFPGATDMFDDFDERGARLAVCTNKPTELAVHLLSELGLKDRFSTIVGSEPDRPRKPDARHLMATIETVKPDRQFVVMVGDSSNDIEVARRCKVPSVAVGFGYPDRPIEELGADLIIDDFASLVPKVPQLFDKD